MQYSTAIGAGNRVSGDSCGARPYPREESIHPGRESRLKSGRVKRFQPLLSARDLPLRRPRTPAFLSLSRTTNLSPDHT